MKIETINGDIRPLTIIADRYNGGYSGGKFVAFNLEFKDVPESVYGGDIECGFFWDTINIPYGIGDTPNAAMIDMFTKYEMDELLD